MKTLRIERMQIEDLDSILAIESRVFPDPWSMNMFREQLELERLYLLVVARIDDEIVGYGGLLRIRDEGHITNFAVKPECQSKGIGKSIIYYLMLLALKEAINSVSLEVRINNHRAQKLYELFGFKKLAIRKHYYGYEDDAYIMSADAIGSSDYQRKLENLRSSLNYQLEDCLNMAS